MSALSALGLVELERVAGVLTREFAGARVERWVEPSPGRLCFTLYRRSGDDQRKAVLELDARPEVAHVGQLPRMPAAPDAMPAFCAYLRAHLAGARLESAALRGGDRQLALGFTAAEGRFTLLLSILGRRSNLYLLDASDRLLQALRPLRETRSELALQGPWIDPASGPPRAGEDRFAGVGDDDLLERIAAHYAGAEATRTQDDVRRTLAAAIKRERKAAERRIESIESELREADAVGRLEREGELLKANLGRVVPGAASVVVTDFATGEPIEIALDPKLSARANLEAIFKRYQKLVRRLAKAGGQIDAAREALREWLALDEEVAAAATIEPLLERERVKRLLVRAEAAPARSAGPGLPERPALPAAYRDLPKKLHPRRYRTAADLEIWVGRSDEANDYLTTRLARGKDLFFHLAGAPGSHVILRTGGREDPPSEALLDACELAVHFSKAKNAGSAEVHVVPIKNVKKPRGAKPGLVYVTGGRSLHLRREAGRLERVLAARIDE